MLAGVGLSHEMNNSGCYLSFNEYVVCMFVNGIYTINLLIIVYHTEENKLKRVNPILSYLWHYL